MSPRTTILRSGIAVLSLAACAVLSGCVVSPADSNPQQASLPLPPATTTVRETATTTATSTVTAEPVTETMYIIPDAFTETVTVTPEPVTETVYPEPLVETVFPEPVVETVVVTETVEVYIQQQAQAAPAPVTTYYPNCAAARAAGVAPIYEGQPGYGTHLDRDRDGIACECPPFLRARPHRQRGPMTPHASAPPRKTLRRILAFATISIGLLLFFTSFSVGGWRDTLGGILMGSALILPGAWFLWAEKNDRDRFAAYEEKLRQHVYYSGLLGPEDQPVVSGMGTPEPPRPVNRRWGLIYLGSVALFALAATVLPPTETTAGEHTTVTSTPTP